MANAAFDTLTVSKDLQEAGFEARQAEAIALAFKQSQGDLATKQDIALLKSEIDHVRTDLKTEIDYVKTDLKTAINWTKWSMAAIIAVMLAGFGFIAS